jgi:hypothetical protein
MRAAKDCVFIDCGPVGMAGRGGHGHNDCLSFEAVLLGKQLVTDCGTYVYTSSPDERNGFRSTRSHNTPQIDAGEINRFAARDQLWLLHNDARPEVRCWQTGEDLDLFCGSHSGFRRLASPVTPVRTLILHHTGHMLIIEDQFEFERSTPHTVSIPLHLAWGVEVSMVAPGRLRLSVGGQGFCLAWGDALAWQLRIDPARVSPRYRMALPTYRLCWRRTGILDIPLIVCLSPEADSGADPWEVAVETLRAQDRGGAWRSRGHSQIQRE